MTAIEIGLTVLAFVLAPGLVVLALLWVRAWLRDRRIERQAADAAIDRFFRREFRGLEDTFDDGPPTQT